jgi:hypothetical protein
MGDGGFHTGAVTSDVAEHGGADSTAWWLSPRLARFVAALMPVLAIECWLNLGRGDYGRMHQPWLLLGALIAGLIPPVRRGFDWLWRRIAHPTMPARLLTAAVIAAAAAPFLYWCMRYEGIPIHPKVHDEFSYLIQARMLAQGRLVMPAHPCAKFFDTFYLIVQPVYASMYFPGAAMAIAPTIWLRVSYFLAPLVESGLCAAMLYLVITEVLDGASGILAAMLLVSVSAFRMMSIMAMANTLSLLLGLTMTFAYLNWRRRFGIGWLVLLGAASGWAAITRPADGLCFAAVLGIAMLMDLRCAPLGAWIKTAVLLPLAASPFFLIQLRFNHDVTGHWLQTPFTYYTDRNYPGAAYGFHSTPATTQHVSDITQKQFLYEDFAQGNIQRHHQLSNLLNVFILQRAQTVSWSGVPDPFFWGIIPLSLFAMWDRRLWAIWGVLPMFLLIYSGYSFLLGYYIIMTFAATILLTVLPIRFFTDVFPRQAGFFRTSLSLAILALAVVNFPQTNRIVHDQYFETPELERINALLGRDVLPPAVVLFHFNRNALINGKRVTDNAHEEPVFNVDVAWPDDAPIIRAQDLNGDVADVGKPGDSDRPLYEYYLRTDPRRTFYLYDRRGGDGRLTRLGTAAEMVSVTNPSR